MVYNGCYSFATQVELRRLNNWIIILDFDWLSQKSVKNSIRNSVRISVFGPDFSAIGAVSHFVVLKLSHYMLAKGQELA